MVQKLISNLPLNWLYTDASDRLLHEQLKLRSPIIPSINHSPLGETAAVSEDEQFSSLLGY